MILLENRKARFNYDIVQTIEAGLVLEGWEVKSIKARSANLKPAYIYIENGEAVIRNFHISPWRFGQGEQNSLREKKLLLHKKELLKLESQMSEKKVALVPLKIYLSKGKIKCAVGVGKGRQQHEKRQVLKERTMDREAQKAIKGLR